MRVRLAMIAFALGCGGSTPHEKTDPIMSPEEPRHVEPDSRESHLANMIQLTRDSGENAEAYWSFAGDQLVFQTKRPPYQCDQIMTVRADGTEKPKMVSTGKGRTTCAYFTHDDKRVIYSSTHEAGAACPPVPDMSQGYVWPIYAEYDVFSALPDGSDLRRLTNSPGYDAEATVCAKDGSIIFTSTRDGDLDLYRMDADGKNVKRLTHEPGYDGGAFFSQDCSQIVWRASRPKGAALADYQRLLAKGLVRPGALEIFVAKADGTDVRQVTSLGAASFAPYFHPSGKRVLFSTNYPNPRGREFDIWAINTNGTGLERITYAKGFDGFPMFSPDGKKLAFASNRNQAKPGETDVFVADWVEGAPPKSVGAAERFLEDVRWLASDQREGRGVGTAGIEQAAKWLAERYAEIGLKPGTPTGYRQEMPVTVGLSSGPKSAFQVGRRKVDASAFVPASFSKSTSVRGRTVFAEYGIVAPKLGIDDYKGLRVKGKVVVVRRFVPPALKTDADKRRYSDIYYKAFAARERGAIGLIVVDAPDSNRPPAEAALPKLEVTRLADVGIPVVIAKRSAAAALTKRSQRVSLSVELVRSTKPSANVVGVLRGDGSQSGALIIGAHYDHLGQGGQGSLEHHGKGIHNGADDNASGTAALLEVARVLAKGPKPKRDIYFVAFTAEESGLLGSSYFVRNPPKGLVPNKAIAMLNMDMVGRMRDGKLAVLGGGTAREWPSIVEPACEKARVRCDLGGSGYGPSDQTPFYAAGVPVLHFFTGAHGEYHKTSDDTELINAGGGAQVASIVARVAAALAERVEPLSYQKVAPVLPRGDSRSFGASLGTIPDYAAGSKSVGVLLGGVRPGGPAEKAGLRKGDLIIKIGSTEVRSVQDLVFVLRSASPGDKAAVLFVRDGKRQSTTVTFGKSRGRRR